MTFQDIFKKTFFQNIQSVSLLEATTSMILALILGLIIYSIYRYTYSGVIYSKNFAISLVAVCTITSIIVITLASNVVLSLGMVGALSIVRFRTAIKEPLDVVYIFWAITIGIVSGAGLYAYATLSTVIIGLLFFLMNLIKEKHKKFIVIINYEKIAHEAVQDLLNKTKYILRSKTITTTDIELVLELDIKGEKSMFINQISEIPNVTNVSMVNYKSGI